MRAYLRKIAEDTSIEIDLQRIMGWDLCKINKHFLQFPIKPSHYHVNHLTHDKLIYHKILFDFFLRYFDTHLGNTLLVDDMPHKTYLNSPFDAIFVKSYEYMLKEYNYLMKTILSYLEFFHYFKLCVPTFVELYLFGAIKSIKEDNVKFQMLSKKCTMAYSASFCRNCLTSVINNPNNFFFSFLPMLFRIFQSHWFLWSIYIQTFTTTICLFFSDYQCALS